MQEHIKRYDAHLSKTELLSYDMIKLESMPLQWYKICYRKPVIHVFFFFLEWENLGSTKHMNKIIKT